MKKTRICLCVAAFSMVLLPALCADDDVPTRTVNINYTFDERGDALLEISFQHTAARWNQWKEAYGNHPDLLLRDFRYQFASAALDDFAFEKDDIHRRAVSRIKARALAHYRGNGDYLIDVPKEMKLVAGSGTEWAFTSTGMTEGEILSQTVHAKLPPGAMSARYGPGGDYDQLTYSVNVAPARPAYLAVMGSILLFLGLAAAVVSFAVGAKPTRATIPAPPPVPPEGQPRLPNTPNS